jgi:hypothetical protein
MPEWVCTARLGNTVFEHLCPNPEMPEGKTREHIENLARETVTRRHLGARVIIDEKDRAMSILGEGPQIGFDWKEIVDEQILTIGTYWYHHGRVAEHFKEAVVSWRAA